MSKPSRQTAHTDERDDGQLVDTGLSVVEPTAVGADAAGGKADAQQ